MEHTLGRGSCSPPRPDGPGWVPLSRWSEAPVRGPWSSGAARCVCVYPPLRVYRPRVGCATRCTGGSARERAVAWPPYPPRG